ncbi:unnamed protein product [Linum tenue]|uniref:TIR domain-containing protein n=1 Tax=Linum tenue TaxID=586396 RepID=A0AAV0K6U2_9ROSI|nr:unnamed protein product [Linum tenue]
MEAFTSSLATIIFYAVAKESQISDGMFSSGMTSNIRGAATVAALVLPLILLYKLLWSRRRSTSNDETSDDNNCDSTSQLQPDSQLPLPTAQYFDPTDSSDLLPFPSVEYEVFLSFRGPDTRHQITDILFRFLVHLKIHTFKDDDELRTGEGIWPSLVKAIGQSKIYVPILSKSYAHSRWCLKELVEIVENMRQDKRRIVLPIFYMVDPRDVRHQTGPYRDAFREHEKNFDRQTIQNWKAALTTVGALKGWHVTHNDEQSKYADLVSDSIWSHLRRFYCTVETDELVAIDGHVEEVVKRLSLDFKDVTMVGLHGMGGIGKTTLAKVVYNKILSHFDRCSFVENIRETQHQNDGIFKIQKKIIEDATRKEDRVCDVSQGRRIIMDRVSQFKVLIVLDDVDEEFKFGEVVGNPRGFVSGSRFIVTSRDCKMLSRLNENKCKLYEVQALSPSHSVKLFSKHAFKKDYPPPDYEILSSDIVSTMGGLPLALEVVGSLLHREEKSIWEAKLKQLREVPEKHAIERLKISYDALEYEAKEIFLDIACFYIGRKKVKPFYMWNDCNFNPTININLLIQRSMVKIDQDGCRFQMHDQLRDMGREIVRRENIEYPWMRSRIWTVETAVELLHEKKNLSSLRYFKAPPDAKLKGDFDNLLPNLRWLKMRYHRGRLGDDDHLINFHMKKLVILDLSGSDVCNDWGGWTHLKMANNLKTLNLSKCGRLTRLPELPQSGSLEVLDLSSYRWLKSTRDDELDIGKLRNLMVLRLPRACIKKITGGTIGTISKGLRELDVEECECENLAHVLADVGELQSLQILRTRSANWKQGTHQQVLTRRLAAGSSNLKELTTSSSPVVDLPRLLELETLVVESCEYGLEIPTPAEDDHYANNQVLPWWKISKLKYLRLHEASRMWCSSGTNNNPGSNCRLPSALTRLHIICCTQLEWLPNLENMENLIELIIENCPMPREIQGLGSLKSLQTLQISDVANLRRLDGLSTNNNGHMRQCSSSLAVLVLERCGALERLPSFSQLRKLFTLNIVECPLLTEIPLLGCLLSSANKLQELCIQDCPRLAALSLITGSVATMPSSLQRLVITGCTSLLQERRWPVQIPNLSNFPRLRILHLKDMRIDGKQSVALEGLECLEELEALILGNLQPPVERLPSLSHMTKLMSIEIMDMPSLREIEGFGSLMSLFIVKLRNCSSLERLELSGLRKLRSLQIMDMPSLREIEGFASLKSLATLQLTDCTSLKMLDLSGLENLEVLDISRCPKLETVALSSLSNPGKLRSLEIMEMPSLREVEGLANLKSLQTLNLRGCTSLGNVTSLGTTLAVGNDKC